jgi:hypothetical protein
MEGTIHDELALGLARTTGVCVGEDVAILSQLAKRRLDRALFQIAGNPVRSAFEDDGEGLRGIRGSHDHHMELGAVPGVDEMLSPNDVIEVLQGLTTGCLTRRVRNRACREDENETREEAGEVTHVAHSHT